MSMSPQPKNTEAFDHGTIGIDAKLDIPHGIFFAQTIVATSRNGLILQDLRVDPSAVIRLEPA